MFNPDPFTSQRTNLYYSGQCPAEQAIINKRAISECSCFLWTDLIRYALGSKTE